MAFDKQRNQHYRSSQRLIHLETYDVCSAHEKTYDWLRTDQNIWNIPGAQLSKIYGKLLLMGGMYYDPGLASELG